LATVLEECITEELRSVVRFLLAKGLNTKDIHKEMFLVYDGKCLSRKGVHIWAADVTLMKRLKLEVRKWLRRQSKDFYVMAGFDALVKRRDKCIIVGGGYV
jgi:hypothetical protein